MAAGEKEEEKAIGITARKEENFSEWYQQVISKGELVDYSPVSGCYVLRPSAMAIWERVRTYVDEYLAREGVKNVYFPLFIPESLLKKEARHVEGFAPEVAWVTKGGDKKLAEPLAIRPTSETIMYGTFARWIRSYRDLPLKINQWCNIVRWEFRDPVPLLRSREFLWQEGHTAFSTRQEAEKEVKEIVLFYKKVFEELYAIPVIAGRKSEKERFAGADYTLSLETFLPNGKAAQGATSHFLGQNFSTAFGIKFLDENGGKQFAWQNSWGLSTRTIGIMVMFHSDNKGLVIPPRLAATKAIIVPIFVKGNKEEILEEAEKVRRELEEKGISVLLDSREEYSPGWKYNEWEMKGIPVRIEIGPKDIAARQLVLVRRDNSRKETIKIKDAARRTAELLEDIQKTLFEKAKRQLEESTVMAENWKAFEKAIAQKKLVLAPWCGEDECESSIKDKTQGAKSLNIPFEQPRMKKNKCFHCGGKVEFFAYFAKSY